MNELIFYVHKIIVMNEKDDWNKRNNDTITHNNFIDANKSRDIN